MADEAKKPETPDDGDATKGGVKALLTKMPVLIGGVMVVEAAVLFVGFKMLAGGPAEADAHGVPDAHGEHDPHGAGGIAEAPAFAEVPVDSFRAPNRLNGRTYLYDVEISVRVAGDVQEKVAGKLAASKSLVRDRMNRIVASIDPQKLNGAAEPGLETLRRQVKYQLDLIVGDGLIEEVLVPRCIPYRTDY